MDKEHVCSSWMRARVRLMSRASILLAVIAFISASVASAQTASGTRVLTSPPANPSSLQQVSPFTMTGFLQKATLDKSADVLSGGTMVVNGFTVIVPRNSVV